MGAVVAGSADAENAGGSQDRVIDLTSVGIRWIAELLDAQDAVSAVREARNKAMGSHGDLLAGHALADITLLPPVANCTAGSVLKTSELKVSASVPVSANG